MTFPQLDSLEPRRRGHPLPAHQIQTWELNTSPAPQPGGVALGHEVRAGDCGEECPPPPRGPQRGARPRCPKFLLTSLVFEVPSTSDEIAL